MRSSMNVVDENSSETLSEISMEILPPSDDLKLYFPTTPQSISDEVTPTPSPVNAPKTKRKISAVSNEDQSFTDAVGAFKKLCEVQIEKVESNNLQNETINGFGKMIVGLISAMSPEKQDIAMEKVTSLVMQIKSSKD